MCYLAGYEVMFRGYLLFPLAAMLGVWPAIGISTMLYTVMHFHKGMGETLACLPAGVLICWIALQTESVFLAWAGHVVVALFNTTYQVLRRPEIEWAGWRAAEQGQKPLRGGRQPVHQGHHACKFLFVKQPCEHGNAAVRIHHHIAGHA